MGSLHSTTIRARRTYQAVPLALLFGLVLPLPFYFLYRYLSGSKADDNVDTRNGCRLDVECSARYHKAEPWAVRLLRHLHTPILASHTGGSAAGANAATLLTFVAGFTAQLYLRRRRPAWFRRYNYLLSAALDGGSQVMVFVLALTVMGGVDAAWPFPKW